MRPKIAVVGATGRMGRRVIRRILDAPDLTLAAALVSPSSAHIGTDAGLLVGSPPVGVPVDSAGLADSQVVIDFSLPESTMSLLSHLDGRALVTGVTGLTDAQQQRLDAYATTGPLLQAANFSTGVNLMLALVEIASAALPDHHIEVLESHHAQKVDAPSGTALALARQAADARGQDLEESRVDGRRGRTGPRTSDEIGLHSLRIGGITGHHEVWFGDAVETLKIGHVALDRDIFAEGSLRAARWIAGREPGAYRMSHVLGLPSGHAGRTRGAAWDRIEPAHE